MSKLLILKANSDAMHKLGNIKRESDSLVEVVELNEKEYIGNFIEGFGFINVIFKKEDCRELTVEEIEFVRNSTFSIGNRYFKVDI